MKHIVLILLLLNSLILSNVINEKHHLSLIIHENLINDFFSNMGEITGSGGNSVASYEWKLVNPHVEIEQETIHFISDISISVGDYSTTKNIIGYISSTFDSVTNSIDLKIEEAKVVIDVDFWGSNYIVTELDLAGFFPNAFSLNGPNVLNKQVDFKLPNGETRIVSVELKESYLVLDKDIIQVYSILDFKR